MPVARAMLVASVLSACGALSARADSVLLSSYSCMQNWQHGGEQVDTPIRVYLEVGPFVPGQWYTTPVGEHECAYWQAGSSGSYDFTPAVTGFALLQSLWTDGEQGFVRITLLRPHGDGTSSCWIGTLESLFLSRPVDLVGNRIDFVRLYVDSVTFTWNPDTHANGVVAGTKWEVWGQPVPEPAGALLALVGLTVLRRRGRPDRPAKARSRTVLPSCPSW